MTKDEQKPERRQSKEKRNEGQGASQEEQKHYFWQSWDAEDPGAPPNLRLPFAKIHHYSIIQFLYEKQLSQVACLRKSFWGIKS